MKKCVVHIGMHKTGTTSIQNSLHRFSDTSFYYANIGASGNHSVAIYSMLTARPENHLGNRHRSPAMLAEYIQNVQNDLCHSLSAAGSRTLIISGEDIGQLQEDALIRLRDLLLGDRDEIQILGYVRPPKSFVSSAFQQQVRSGGISRIDLGKLYRNYRNSFEKFDRIFGRDAVTLKLFDRQALVGGDSVLDFCATLGIDFPASRISRHNESISRELLCLIYQYNKYCAENRLETMMGSDFRATLGHIRPIGNSKFRFSPQFLDRVVGPHAEDIAWMEHRLGKSLAEADGESLVTDVSSEMDLLQPVPGAREALLEALAASGVTDIASGTSDAELLHQLRMALHGTIAARRPRPTGKRQADRPVRRRTLQQQDVRPLINPEKSIMVLWSPKSASAAVYSWFAHVSGFGGEVRFLGAKILQHRAKNYFKSDLFRRGQSSDPASLLLLKVIRDPYERAVSVFRSIVESGVLDDRIATVTGVDTASRNGLSFIDFLDYLKKDHLNQSVNRVKPQFHSLERKHKPNLVVNVSKQSLAEGLHDFERLAGLQATDLTQMGCPGLMSDFSGKQYRQVTGGQPADETAFTKEMIRSGIFPTPEQILTDAAKDRIRWIYRIDFEAYAPYL